MPVEDFKYFLMACPLEAEIFEDPANRLAFVRGPVLLGMDHGQGGLTLAQVTGNRLAQHLLGGGQVQHVVHDLESDPQVSAIFPHLFLHLLGGSCQNRPRRMETSNRHAVLR